MYQARNAQVNAAPDPRYRPARNNVECANFRKISVAFASSEPKLKLPPRPGPGSSGHSVLGNPSTPQTGCPPLIFRPNFAPIREFHPSSHHGNLLSAACRAVAQRAEAGAPSSRSSCHLNGVKDPWLILGSSPRRNSQAAGKLLLLVKGTGFSPYIAGTNKPV